MGNDVMLEHASGEGSEQRLPALARALVDKRVDVIWAAGPEAAVAAARATTSIPIAFYGVAYRVETELVDSLPGPGRNVTGLASVAGTGYAKVLELLRGIAPKASRLAWISVDTVVWSVSGKQVRLTEEATVKSAGKLGFELLRFRVAKREDFDGVFAAIRAFVEAGGLVSYAVSAQATIARSMEHVVRILRGADPAHLPVELPESYEMAINLKTAKLLGLAVPPSVLLRADRLIE